MVKRDLEGDADVAHRFQGAFSLLFRINKHKQAFTFILILLKYNLTPFLPLSPRLILLKMNLLLLSEHFYLHGRQVYSTLFSDTISLLKELTPVVGRKHTTADSKCISFEHFWNSLPINWICCFYYCIFFFVLQHRFNVLCVYRNITCFVGQNVLFFWFLH